jgi:hypothetical protein
VSVAQIVAGSAPDVRDAAHERLQSAVMGAVEYTNLRLSFKQQGDREYEVIASIDDGPPATSRFTIPMSDDALQEAIRNLSATRSALKEPTTRKVTPVTEHTVSAQEFGTTLADALLTGDVERMFNEARSRGAVRVRLNMTNEPELLRIPWEFLRRNGRDLASQRDSTIVRELETAEPARPHHVTGKIRMLGVIANPKQDLDVAGEKLRVEEAIAKCRDHIDLEWLENCTYRTLQRKLLDPYHILHFVGHGAFTADGEAILLLSDENGQQREVPANAIAQLIGGQKSLQLVVLNSCDGARTKLDDPFAGIATILVQQGNSAVIAMQFEITDAAAKTFAEELYFCLIDRRYPVDAAVAEARKASELNPASSQLRAVLGYALAKSGKQAEARVSLEELLKSSAGHRVSPYWLALIYNGLDERDKALVGFYGQLAQGMTPGTFIGSLEASAAFTSSSRGISSYRRRSRPAIRRSG